MSKKFTINIEETYRIKIKTILSLLLFIVSFAFVVYYIIVPGKVEFHSDCTDTLMWAQAGYDAGSVFNPDFKYACLLPFGTSLIMQAFIGITGVSYTTHCIGMIIFAFLFSAAFVFMLKQAKFSLAEISASYSVLVFLLSASAKLREIFWGHTIYYSLGLLFLFTGLGILFKMLEKIENKQFDRGYTICFVSICLLIMLSALNGIQAITIFILPVLGALFGSLLLDFDEKLNSKKSLDIIFITVAIAVAAAFGMLFADVLAGGITAGYETAFSRLDSSDNWLSNAQKLLKSWLLLSGISIKKGQDLMSVNSIFNIVGIFLNLLLVLMPIYRVFTYERIIYKETKIFLLAHWICTVLIMIAWVFGRISSANWRLTPIFCTSVVFFIFFVREIADTARYKRLAVIFMLFPVIWSIYSMVGIIKLDTDFEKSEKGQLISLLEENDCKYGYATFWNANAVTVLTGEEISVRNIDVVDGEVEKYEYQSQRSWFKDQPGVEEYFVLLTESEFEELVEADNQLIDTADDIIRNDEFTILKFKENIF